MGMVLVWNDVASFRKHLELMSEFRQSHRSNSEARLALLKTMPALHITRLAAETGGARGIVGTADLSTLVPVKEHGFEQD